MKKIQLSVVVFAVSRPLVTGLENSGFKLHYLFFYRWIHGSYNKTYANKIELDLHDVLRNHENYKSHVIHMPSSKPSEWYLPHSGDYESFLNLFWTLSVQVPAPEDAFEFYVVNNMDVRKDKKPFQRIFKRGKYTNIEKITKRSVNKHVWNQMRGNQRKNTRNN